MKSFALTTVFAILVLALIRSAQAEKVATPCRVYEKTPENETGAGKHWQKLISNLPKDDKVAKGDYHARVNRLQVRNQAVDLGYAYGRNLIELTVFPSGEGHLSRKNLRYSQYKYTFVYNNGDASTSFWLDTDQSWCKVDPSLTLKSFDATKVAQVDIYRRER
ncbi:hypothetical protein CBS101457_006755 [Exobasidium rhododendri]|nr:hypothetical protein CBS101457_006755 [Exobasidium rhododendri]